MTDLTVLAQAIYSDTIQAIKNGPTGYDTIARNAATATASSTAATSKTSSTPSRTNDDPHHPHRHRMGPSRTRRSRAVAIQRLVRQPRHPEQTKMTTPTVRGRVWRNLINVATVHDTEFVHIPAGWGWRVRERAPNGAWTTLIDGVEATHQAALSRACRHIRLAHNLDHDPLAPMAPADSRPPAELGRP